MSGWQLVAHPDSDVCDAALVSIQRALRRGNEMLHADTALNIAEMWERLSKNGVQSVDLIVMSSSMPENAHSSPGASDREPTKQFIKQLKQTCPQLSIVVASSTPDEPLADFLDEFEHVGLVTVGTDFGSSLIERITLLRQASCQPETNLKPQLKVSAKLPLKRKTKPDSWIELDIHLGGQQRGGWQMNRIGLDEFKATGTLQVDNQLVRLFVKHSKNLDDVVARNGDRWFEDLKELSDELRNLLFRSARDNMDFWDRFLKHRERVGGVSRSRVRLTVDDDTHSMLFEALRDSEEADDEFWVLNAPVFRRYAQQLSYPALFKEKDRVSRMKPINCLVIEADPAPGNVMDNTGQFEQLFRLQHLEKEAEDVRAILVQHAGGCVEKLRLSEAADVQASLLSKLGERQWHLVHFCGHVASGVREPALVLRADQSGLLSIESFAKLLGKTQLLFLSSCRSAATRIVMHAVERHVSAVIGFQWVIDDRAASIFAVDFYDQLFDNSHPHSRDLEYALLEARRRSYKRMPSDPSWVSPVLVMQMG